MPFTDEELYKIIGINKLNAMETQRALPIVENYGITGDDHPGIIQYARDCIGNFVDDEIFPRDQWDIPGLSTCTEQTMMHEHCYRLSQNPPPRQHDVLSVIQCTSFKPYAEQKFARSVFRRYFGQFSDFVSITEPGIVPWELSHLYPYRFDNWDEIIEGRINPIVDIHHKYNVVNSCRFLKYVRDMGYKHVIIYVWKDIKQLMFNYLYEHNVDNCRSWMSIVFNPSFMDLLYKDYPGLIEHPNLMNMRANCLPHAFKRYGELLLDVAGSQVQDAINLYNAQKGRSKVTHMSEYVETKPFKSFYETVSQKNSININLMKRFHEIPRESNSLYKKYYWTCLDILLWLLDGNLVQDIDKEYWKLMDYLNCDQNFKRFHGFCYIYKPFLVNGFPTVEQCIKEAKKLKLIMQWTPPKIKRSLLNGRNTN